jgi:hypothetical protein
MSSIERVEFNRQTSLTGKSERVYPVGPTFLYKMLFHGSSRLSICLNFFGLYTMSTTASKSASGAMTPAKAPQSKPDVKENIPLSTHLIAGGTAGLAEALAW